MKKTLLMILLALFLLPVVANALSICDYFPGKSGCFLLYNQNQSSLLTQYNPARCAEKMPRPNDWSGADLTISADEQLAFMKTKEAILTAKKSGYLETSPKGWKLYGKTGYSKKTEDGTSQGWFIGFIEKADQVYIFVLNFSDLPDPKALEGAGPRAKEIAKTLLTKMNLF